MDVAVMQTITEWFQSPLMTQLMRLITSLGSGAVLWILFFLYLYFIKKDKRTAWFLAAAVITTSLINDGLIKHLINRPRPFIDHPELPALIAHPMSSSFPSGHSATSFAALTVLMTTEKPTRWLAMAGAILIAFSRIYLHVHYPTDVLAGMLVGICVGAVMVKVMRKDRMPVPKPIQSQ